MTWEDVLEDEEVVKKEINGGSFKGSYLSERARHFMSHSTDSVKFVSDPVDFILVCFCAKILRDKGIVDGSLIQSVLLCSAMRFLAGYDIGDNKKVKLTSAMISLIQGKGMITVERGLN